VGVVLLLLVSRFGFPRLALGGGLACRLATAFVRDDRDALISRSALFSLLDGDRSFGSSDGALAWMTLLTEGLLRRGESRLTRLMPWATYLPLEMYSRRLLMSCLGSLTVGIFDMWWLEKKMRPTGLDCGPVVHWQLGFMNMRTGPGPLTRRSKNSTKLTLMMRQ